MRDLSTLSSGFFLLKIWKRLRALPGGKCVFSWMVGRIAPYSGTIRPIVEELGPGHCRIRLRERRGLRNHLNSIHAIALANVAELASGLGFVVSVPDESRAILVGLRIEYKKKGRGIVTAESRFDSAQALVHGEHEVPVKVFDSAGNVVVEASARWLVGPKKAST